MDQESPRKLVKAHGNVELENERRMPKESKWVEDAQGVGNGTKEPTSSVMGQESPKQHEYKSNEIGPASMGQIISQQEWQSGTTRMVARL